jgi:hypothetical protein
MDYLMDEIARRNTMAKLSDAEERAELVKNGADAADHIEKILSDVQGALGTVEGLTPANNGSAQQDIT